MTTLLENTPAPFFSGIDQHGKKVSLTKWKGKKVVLFFYPKDDTTSCTAEACNLRDNYRILLKKGLVVVGVSPDSVKSHSKFAAKYQLKYTLIADEDRRIAMDYKVYGEKLFFGKIITGIYRTTFIIDENGLIQKIITKVKTKDHTQQILEALGEE